MNRVQIISDKNQRSLKIKSLIQKKIKQNNIKRSNITIVIGGDVRVTPAAVSHGSLTVKVNEATNTPPGQTLFDDAGNVTQATDANTENDTEIKAGAETASAFVFDAGTSLADVVDAINAIGTTSSDLVAILEALRAAGALRAQMIII